MTVDCDERRIDGGDGLFDEQELTLLAVLRRPTPASTAVAPGATSSSSCFARTRSG